MRTSKPFGQRSVADKTKTALRKYYLIFEGEKTEVDYFNGVNDNRDEIGINNLIELVPLLRNFSKKSFSHPKHSIPMFIEYIEEWQSGIIKRASFIDRLIDYMELNASLNGTDVSMGSMQKLLEEIVTDDVLIADLDKSTDKVCVYIENKTTLSFSSADISSYINSQKIVYERGFDEVCLIADRDKQNFSSEQYNKILSACNENKYKFYITNPCIEFWLLLHFDEVLDLNRDEMLQNKPENKSKKFLEKTLSDILGGYNKSRIDFLKFKDRIDTAIKNEQQFCEDISALKDELGCNIGLLISELKR